VKTQEIDPIKYEMFYNRLEQTMTEGKEVTRKLSASVISRDAGEVSQGIYTKDGKLAHMAASILIHCQTISRSIRYMLDNHYEDDIGLYEGDQFINNDPFIGGTHRPDQLMMAPLFHEGKLVGWTGTFSHVAEIGAIDPGGMCARATESYHEGILLPCVKIVEKGKTRRDVFRMMALTGRVSREMEIDTRAKIAGNERIRKRIAEIINEYGIDFFLAALDKMIEEAEQQAVQKVSQLRPGIYRNRVYVDHTGREEKLSIIEVEAAVTKKGELILGAPVVSPQRKAYNNTSLGGVVALTISELLIHFFYDIRWNEGVLKPVRIEGIPERSMLNADRTAAVAYGLIGEASHWELCLTDVMSRAIFTSGNDKDVMASSVLIGGDIVGGIDKFGRRRIGLILDCCAYPGGARCDMDGINSSAFIVNPWGEAPDLEATEMDLPVLTLGRQLMPDTGGFGQFRGGNAVEGVYLTHGSEIGHATYGIGSKAYGAQGLFGGYPGSLGGSMIVRGSKVPELIAQKAPLPHTGSDLLAGMAGGKLEFLPSQKPFEPLQEGDIICFIQWGAPGLGDPIEREPSMIVKDLAEKYTTLRVAKDIYCVAVEPETFKVNEEKTKLMRAGRRKERLSKGIPARDYIKTMVKARKNEKVPARVHDFLEETKAFSERFRRELEAEETLQLPKNGSNTITVGKELFKLTPYVSVAETNKGKGLTCSRCGHYYCDAGENFKHYSLVYDRDPKEIYGDRFGADKDWMIFREFYCPGCGSMVEVEATPVCTPIFNNYEVEI
jgi:N-methylhydantoinase B/oxoprolinase/acetone carboxylase alpha subunit